MLDFFDLVDGAYNHADDDRTLIERSLELSSKEMEATNEELQRRVLEAEEKTAEFEKLNSLMVGRELKMIELKAKISQYEQDSINK